MLSWFKSEEPIELAEQGLTEVVMAILEEVMMLLLLLFQLLLLPVEDEGLWDAEALPQECGGKT